MKVRVTYSKKFLACLALTLISGQDAQADLISAPSYKAKWVTPIQQRIFNSKNSKTNATLVITQKIFDEGQAQTSGYLTIKRYGKLKGTDRYVSEKEKCDIVMLKGPMLAATGDEDEAGVEVRKQCYQKNFDYEYWFDAQKNKYIRRDPSIEPGDESTQIGTISGKSLGTAGDTSAELRWTQKMYEFGGANWKLTISKGNKTVLSQRIFPPENAGGSPQADKAPENAGGSPQADKTPECAGPFVSTALDSSHNVLVDLRMARVVKSARLNCEIIYYFDKAARKFKSTVHEWGLNAPRLADLRGDGQLVFVTEDWNLSKPEMGGPIQIWRWSAAHKLNDFTKQYPEEIKKHSQAALKQWIKEKRQTSLLAYIGDLCLLGRTKFALSELKRLNPTADVLDKIIAALKREHYM